MSMSTTIIRSVVDFVYELKKECYSLPFLERENLVPKIVTDVIIIYKCETHNNKMKWIKVIMEYWSVCFKRSSVAVYRVTVKVGSMWENFLLWGLIKV